MQKRLFSFLSIVLMCIFSIAYGKETEWEDWGNLQISKGLQNNLSASFKTELRYRDSFDQYFNYFDLGLSWKAKRWVSFSANFRHITKESGSQWVYEYWPYGDVKFTGKYNSFVLSNRSRFEVRIKEDDNVYVFRDKIDIKFPKFTPFNLQPFISDDVFYDFEAAEIFRNRVHLGLSFPIRGGLSSALSYILESNWKNDVRSDKNILKLDLKYKF